MNRQENLETFFRNGKTVILPIDHGCAIPVPGLENPFSLIDQVNDFVDGYVMNLGVALRAADSLAGKGIMPAHRRLQHPHRRSRARAASAFMVLKRPKWSEPTPS
jgi:DhnA family fructose-bisphosphate aldolase class Ia